MDSINEFLTEDNLVHLHLHTTYSQLDGYNFPIRIAKRAKELGMTAIAMTDHGHLGGAIEFQSACKAEGIKPILGLEAYWTHNMDILSLPKEERDAVALQSALDAGVIIPPKATKKAIKELTNDYQYDTKQYHVILIAINQTGWSNLIKLQSEASARCTFNGRYCCDDSLLEKYNEGLIMTTACIGNTVAKYIIDGEYGKAEAQIDIWHNIFGERLFLEIQPLNIASQRVVNYIYAQWAQEKGIRVIATTDAHYTTEADWDDHDTLLCIGIGKNKYEEDRMRYSNDFWIKSYDEMISGFQEQSNVMSMDFDDIFNQNDYMNLVREALNNTNLIAEEIEDIKLGSDINLFPNFKVPYGMTPEDYLRLKCFRGLYKYYKKKPSIDIHKYEKRLNSELAIINKKGFAPYMLIVDEYTEWAVNNDCPTGPGRGSAAGALTLFSLGITKMIDPIEYNLLFFRFLTEDRTAAPDWKQAA